MEEEKIERGNHTTMMFANGLIVSDKNGEVKKLKDKAIELKDITGIMKGISETIVPPLKKLNKNDT